MIKLKESRFLLAGIWNTLFAYFASLFVYDYLHIFVHILLIGLIIVILNISMSFLTFKFFVFKTQNHWLKEYLRFYITYSVSISVSLILLWVAVDFLNVKFWISQAFAMMVSAILSYIGHNRFTFKIK
jgi:hypothetical protein